MRQVSIETALKYILVCLSVHLTVHFNPISIKDYK